MLLMMVCFFPALLLQYAVCCASVLWSIVACFLFCVVLQYVCDCAYLCAVGCCVTVIRGVVASSAVLSKRALANVGKSEEFWSIE